MALDTSSRVMFQSHDPREYHLPSAGKPHAVHQAFDSVITPILAHVKAHLLAKQKTTTTTTSFHVSHHMIPMRDGVKLSTIVVVPALQPGEKRSTMMSRSPYGPTSDQVADVFTLTNGFVAIVQDQRGTFLSEGEFTMWHNDAEDGFDTIRWITAQPWSNGNVFTTGISADGCGLAAMLLTQPPALKGQLLQWASANGHETTFPGGAFREGLVTGWMTVQSVLTKGVSLKRTLPDALAHEALSDWWRPVQGPGNWHMVRWPTIHLSAWSDIFQGHQFEMFNGYNEQGPKNLRHSLIVGPLGHCLVQNLVGDVDALLDAEEVRGIVNAYGLASETFGGFDAMGTTYRDKMKKINLYVMGSRLRGERATVGHFWTSLDQWPATRPHRLYLTADSQLVMAAVGATRSLRGAAEDEAAPERVGQGSVEFAYDPASPVLTRGGNNLVLTMLGFGCGSQDQRQHEARADVRTFDGEVFTEPVALVGAVRAVLHVSTSANDTDVFVALSDVHPSGHSMSLRSGLRRLKYRDSTPTETVVSPVVPGRVYRVEVDLWHHAYVIAPGHKLRVSVSSSNTPYFAKNDNSGDAADALGLKHDVVATNKVFWDARLPSYVEIPVVPLSALPRNDRF